MYNSSYIMLIKVVYTMKYLLIPMFFLFVSGCTVPNFQILNKNIGVTKVTKTIDKETYKKDLMFEWKIAKGDRVEIRAFNQSSNASAGQLSQLLSSNGENVNTQRVGDEGMLVGADGILILPLIGAVKITGLTEKEASQKLIKEYKKYLKNPYVTVKILNQKLFVLGEVKQPGVVHVTNGTMTLLEALATSGDITDYADRTNIKIIRGDMRDPEVREVNLTDFKSIRYASLILHPNDIIYVSPRPRKASTVGYTEALPFWQVIGGFFAPLSTAAVVYGVTRK